ncbi:MAG: ubiquinol-cytochrome c reductase iron-sulfur subunit [Actinomycetota bacterium]|jgi:ubiquinol-cytochrome c reductase iron-sulfur subunit|nr:ubiquinol-cytochrome c reductase iron-sulfur subunit [Actinomycetota bacterium]
MSDQHHTNPGHPSGADEDAGTTGALEPRFTSPGLAPHAYRRSDIDPKAANRREREVAMLFGLSTLGTLLFIVAYFAVKLENVGGTEMLNRVALSTRLLGLGLGIAMFCIGAGAIHWAKTLMPDDEIVNDRKPMRSSDENRSAAVAYLKEGAAGAGLGRRKLIRNSLLGALAPLGLLALIPLRDLGPLPGDKLARTAWKAGSRLVTDPSGNPVKASEVPIGGVVHVLPEGINDMGHPLEERAKAAVIVIRLAPEELRERKSRRGWSYNGIVAYSQICTHVGCPVGLYEQQTHHLLCPCHQSTFDVANQCAVVFGPAARPLPQLPLAVDSEGYLIAKSGFHEPVGPSFWERGKR